jgi:hypothetical protein
MLPRSVQAMARMLQVVPSSILQKVDFMIVGLAAAALQGAPAVTQDIALWFKDPGDPRIRAALERVGGLYGPPTASTPPLFAGKNVALFDIVLRMDGLGSFDQESWDSALIRLGRTRFVRPG